MSEHSEELKARFQKIMARLRANEFLRLEDGESAQIAILGDIDDWVEMEFHRSPKGRVVCFTQLDAPCAWCEKGAEKRRALVIPIYNQTADQVQLVVWTMHADSPLLDLQDHFEQAGTLRRSTWKITRRGAGRETRYRMSYVGDAENLPDAPNREEVIRRVVNIMGGREEDE
jgi:hypothetical protein